MTICMNYEFEIFERFIGSLFDSIDENVELVIFISKNDEIHLKKLKELYDNINYFIEDISNEHFVNFRFRLYYNYILNNSHKYNYIFLTDSRDVLFQKNIFNHRIIDENADLYIFEEESAHITIDKCKFNSMYVEKTGLMIKDIVKGQPIICAGTILGNVLGLTRYLEEFIKILNNEISEDIRGLYGIDAGINYKIIYSNLLHDIKIFKSINKDNLVYTIAFPNHLGLIDYNKLVNDKKKITYKGDESYCVHQYDRLDTNIKKDISIKYNFIL